MNEFSLQALVSRTSPKPATSNALRQEPKVEEEAEYQAFSFGRVGPRAQHMLEVCFGDGFRWSKPYIEITDIRTMGPEKGFDIYFHDVVFSVAGAKLETCYRYLKQHRLESLRESTRSDAMTQSPEEAVVHSIKSSKPPQDKLSRNLA